MSYPPLPPERAFLHVIYDYRCLVRAGYAWNTIGPPGAEQTQTDANALLPEVGTIALDSLLLHARSLIDFYTKPNPDVTDISLADFGLPQLSGVRAGVLADYKHPIEVHLLHLTAWRDVEYRTDHATTPKGATRDRPDWNVENVQIVSELLDALGEVSHPSTKWQQPFTDLHAASRIVLTNPRTDWPTSLGNEPDVILYLRGLGLA